MTDPTKTHRERINDLRDAAIGEIAKRQTPLRLALLRLQPEFEEIEEEDNYVASLLDIVQEYGDEGITVAKLRLVFSDNSVLSEAKEKLIGMKKIIEQKSGNTLLLKVAPTVDTKKTEAA
jgi:hypothetical protein